MDQTGWSDVLAIDALACSMIKSIGITMTQKVVDWGTNEADAHTFNYDFFHFVMHSSTGTMYDRYYQMFGNQTDYYWNHYGDYRNPELQELIRQLDITTGAAQQAVADQIITIIGTEMPIIPFGGHPNWYQYNTMYWLGFSNKEDNAILPAGPFGGTATSGLMQVIMLGLTANPNAPQEAAAGIPMEYVYAGIIVVVIVIVLVAGYLLMRKPKK
jgi:ABC-type transport system substrate-binding protein